MNFKAAIFDLDGTLVDSLHVWEEIDIRFLEKRGLSVPDDYVDRISACTFKEAADYTKKLFGLSETEDEIMTEWYNMAVHEYRQNIQLVPYALDYIKKLKKCGVKVAVATSAPETLYKPCLKNNRIYDFFDVMCSADEVRRGKDYPDIYLHIAELLGVSTDDCIVFEDVLPAIKSAKKAGMNVIGVCNTLSSFSAEEIKRTADSIIYSFADAPVP